MKLTSMWVSPHAVLLNLKSATYALTALPAPPSRRPMKDRFGFGSEKNLAKLASVGSVRNLRVGSGPHAR